MDLMRWVREIAIWLNNGNRLRNVCCVSFIVGIFHFALSFFFHHHFGKWNLWTIIIYIVLCLFISPAMFFAYIFEYEPQLWLKAHLVFVALELTTAYSFFDEKLDEKPEVYGMVSSASFAIMSLCLSILSQSDVEVDLLNFYCIVLTLQLMKVKMYLFFVGAIFNYFLIMLRFYLLDLTENPQGGNGGDVERQLLHLPDPPRNSQDGNGGNVERQLLHLPDPPRNSQGGNGDNVERPLLHLPDPPRNSQGGNGGDVEQPLLHLPNPPRNSQGGNGGDVERQFLSFPDAPRNSRGGDVNDLHPNSQGGDVIADVGLQRQNQDSGDSEEDAFDGGREPDHLDMTALNDAIEPSGSSSTRNFNLQQDIRQRATGKKKQVVENSMPEPVNDDVDEKEE